MKRLGECRHMPLSGAVYASTLLAVSSGAILQGSAPWKVGEHPQIIAYLCGRRQAAKATSTSMEVQKLREYIGHTAAIYSLSRSAKPGHFISCGSEGFVAEWDLESGEGKAIAQAPSAVFAICLIAERDLLLLGMQSGDLVFVDLRNGHTLKRVQLHKKSIFEIVPMPDGQHVLVSGEDGAISLWNLDQLDHIHWQQVARKSVRTLVLEAGSQRLYAGASDGEIREFDLGLNLLRSWQAHKLSIFRLLVGANGRLYSAGRDAHIKCWDLKQEGRPLEVVAVPAHNYAINDLIEGPHGLLVSGSMDKSIKIWAPDSLELLKVINFEKNQCHWHGVNRLLWLEGNLLSCSDDRKIMGWGIGA
jgi:WD40 repeat protein